MSGSCPWGGMPKSTPASFDDVMSEELAREFVREDLLSASVIPLTETAVEEIQNSPPNTDDDLRLAEILQEEFDREANGNSVDEGLKIVQETSERKLKNGDSIGEEDFSDESDVEEQDVDRFATQQRTNPPIGFRGFSRDNEGVMKT